MAASQAKPRNRLRELDKTLWRLDRLGFSSFADNLMLWLLLSNTDQLVAARQCQRGPKRRRAKKPPE